MIVTHIFQHATYYFSTFDNVSPCAKYNKDLNDIKQTTYKWPEYKELMQVDLTLHTLLQSMPLSFQHYFCVSYIEYGRKRSRVVWFLFIRVCLSLHGEEDDLSSHNSYQIFIGLLRGMETCGVTLLWRQQIKFNILCVLKLENIHGDGSMDKQKLTFCEIFLLQK